MIEGLCCIVSAPVWQTLTLTGSDMLRLARFRLRRAPMILAAVSLIFIVVLSHLSEEKHELSQREVIERMNVYDDFGRLSEEREQQIQALNNPKGAKMVDKDKNLISQRDAKLVFPSNNIDYSRYTDMLNIEKPKYLPGYKNPCWKAKIGNSTKVRCLPYFHLLGVDKCGTTDLWARMKHHPELLPNGGIGGKETHWWSWRRFGFDIWVDDREPWSFEKYLGVFDIAAGQIETTVDLSEMEDDYHPLITGEGSPTTFWDFTGWNRIPQNQGKTVEEALLTPHLIKHIAPKTLFILIFRNPTERLYSDYIFLDLFRQQHNVSSENFHHGVVESIKMFEDCQITRSMKSCLYDKQLHKDIPVRIFVGMYVVYLKEWLKVFNRGRFLIFRNEDYSKNIKQHVIHAFNFLDLKLPSDDEMEKISSRKRAFDQSSKKKSTGPMLDKTRTILNSFYKKYNEELAVLLNNEKYLWKETS
ncbi:hypothetical protein LOTGIDRAFT_156422 [Lottia gigantea]|uniref:Sulfotransferase domain-containing protein n=1 Tax=Lottia gigantea TaxID=225164 RepID=V4B0R8_LOTGI|nr:hypothetical protein LOTGIDRAFT_156422 [Lottia gigantea]ESP03823.1 hypothetical protein LOTGIDRAFT_156422 [Lottia gigantea]